MKANELRIGNYVNEWCCTDKKYYVKKLDIDLLRCIIEDWTECEPIPLTEEWLLKFGFKKWRNKKIYTYKRVSIYLHSIDGLAFGKASSRTKLKYVHQLQNLYFALTGEELTIKE